MRRVPLLLTLAALVASAAPTASAATGDLTFASCQSNAAIADQSCTVNTGVLNTVVGLQVSPDGKSAYALGQVSNTLVVFDRNATTGALTMKTGADGCFANAATGSCTVLTGELPHPEALAISADGKSVYVVSGDIGGSSNGVLVGFSRDTTTGVLTPLAGATGCFANSVVGTCTQLSGQLVRTGTVSISPDGTSVYTAGTVTNLNANGVVTTFSRDTTTGALTYGSCVASAAVGSCTVSSGVFSISASSTKLALSPDGRNAYLNARFSNSLAVFDRDVATGALTLKTGAAGCFANATLGSCTVLSGYLPSPLSVSLSPDGKNVYVDAGGTGDLIDTVIVFSRNATTGELTKLSGASGCLASDVLNDCTVVNPAAQDAANFDSKGVAISPDGLSAYVTSFNWNMLLAFDRSVDTGALTLKSGAAGCFADVAMAPCTTTANLLFAPTPVVISPDGRNVYTGSAFSSKPNVAVFTRAQPPVATTVTPATGTTAGGTTVVIAGTHLDGATQVLFGDTAAIIRESAYASLTVVTPLHVAGKVDIAITTANGTGTFAKAYTYVLPAVRSVVVAEKPKVSYSKTTITFRTIVTVNAAGTISQTFSRVIKGKRVAVCTRKKTVARAGKYPVVCVAGLNTRDAVKRGQIAVRVLTSFAATRTAAVSTVQNLILPRRR